MVLWRAARGHERRARRAWAGRSARASMGLRRKTLRHMALWRCGRSLMAKCPRNAFPGAWRWQDCALMRSRAAIRGNFFTPCIPKGASDEKREASWQDSRAMHPKRAGFGKICAPCIRKAPQTAVGGYTARISCQEGALFAARAPRIMHSAQISPSAAEQRERLQPRRRPYGRRNGVRAASCRAG